jgi:Xaa-Pro aminopeptidase
MLRPGEITGRIYDYALDFMAQLGYQDHFMGTGRDQVPFVGHGLGIEIDEYPFISRGNSMELQAGMVLAVEPKLIFPGDGVIGIEDTFLVTETGAQRLTLSPRGLQSL